MHLKLFLYERVVALIDIGFIACYLWNDEIHD